MVTKINSLRRVLIGLMLLVLCGFAKNASASHYAAVDLYMDYIGTGPGNYKYQVTLVIYKACEPNSISLSNSESVDFASSCSGGFSRLLNQPNSDTLDQLCAQFAPINSCRQVGSPWPAFVRKVYTDTVTLPTACADWVVSWTNSARNAGINNLLNPSGLSIYVEAGLNNVAKWNNSTPRFIVDPIPYLCQNQPAFFLNGPLDPNNDSMVTTNVQPLNTGPFNPCPYNLANPNPPNPYYSLTNPVATTLANPYTVNANTGTATFTPTLTGKFVLAFRCTEYDRISGIYLGHTTRDVQVSVLQCNAAPPDIDSMPMQLTNASWIPTPPSGGYVIACPGVPMSFNVQGHSNTISNSVFLSANNAITALGSVFTVTGQGTAAAAGTFTWTPTGLDIGDHTVIFTIKDSTCNNNQPIVFKNYLVVFIKVLPGVEAGPDGRICELDGTPWQFNVTGPPGVNYAWTGLGGIPAVGLNNDSIPNPQAYPPYNFTYVVQAVNLNSVCKNMDTVVIYIDTSNSILATPHYAVQCRPGYTLLDANGVGNPPLINLPCGTSGTLPPCALEDSIEVQSQSAGGTVVIDSTYQPFRGYRTARNQFLVTKTDMYAYGVRSGTLRGIGFNIETPTPTMYNNFTIALKCTDRTNISPISGGFEPGTTIVYTATTPVATTLGWNYFTFDTPYNWDSTKNIIVEVCYSNAGPGMAANVYGITTSTPSMAVAFTNSGLASVCDNPLIASGTLYYSVRPNIKFTYCKAPYDDFHYTWTPGVFLSDSTAKSPLAYIEQSTKFYVSTIGGNGCKVRDSVEIKVPIHQYDVWPRDTTLCLGQSFMAKAIGDFANVTWYEDTLQGAVPNFAPANTLTCSNCLEPVATPLANTKYYAVMTDVDGCSDTMVVNAKVKPLPIVAILNNDTTLKYGQSVQLLVSGAYLYSWQPVSTLSNPNIVNPVASPTEPTTYLVYGLAENGCRSVDSVHVGIDYHDNLYIPSAFSPNGDGKNDVFRVANLTFQRLMEFRVFNRWGQEIFSTTDTKKGWDGSWKGVPQDMGAYQYLIKVAFPDGLVETYKGNVTLVR